MIKEVSGLVTILIGLIGSLVAIIRATVASNITRKINVRQVRKITNHRRDCSASNRSTKTKHFCSFGWESDHSATGAQGKINISQCCCFVWEGKRGKRTRQRTQQQREKNKRSAHWAAQQNTSFVQRAWPKKNYQNPSSIDTLTYTHRHTQIEGTYQDLPDFVTPLEWYRECLCLPAFLVYIHRRRFVNITVAVG